MSYFLPNNITAKTKPKYEGRVIESEKTGEHVRIVYRETDGIEAVCRVKACHKAMTVHAGDLLKVIKGAIYWTPMCKYPYRPVGPQEIELTPAKV